MSAPNKNVPQQQLLKTLEDLLKLPENRECADCGTKAPRWASTNLGVFLCIRCAGIHRAMGVHVSKMKSVSLDKWAPSEVEFMQHMGNARGKEIYEAYVPDSYHRGDINSENIALENWIRDKYERKRFTGRDGAEPPRDRRRGDDSRGGSYRDQPRERERDYGGDRYERDQHREREYSREQPREREYNREQPREREYTREQPREREYTREQPRDRGYQAEREQPARNTHVSQPPAAKSLPPVRQPAAAAAAAAPPAVDLLNWDEPAPAAAASHAPTSAPSANHGGAGAGNADIFGDFTSAPSSGGGGAGGIAAAPPPADKNSILMLYHTPPPMTQMRPNMPPQMMQQQQHAPPAPNYNIHMGGGMPGQMGMMPPNMGGGQMGMRPPGGMWGGNMMGGIPPTQSGMMGGIPPTQSGMMGGIPPTQSGMMGGIPPTQSGMMGGIPSTQYNMTGLPGGTMPANFFTPPSNAGGRAPNYNVSTSNIQPHSNMNNMMSGLSNLNLRM